MVDMPPPIRDDVEFPIYGSDWQAMYDEDLFYSPLPRDRDASRLPSWQSPSDRSDSASASPARARSLSL